MNTVFQCCASAKAGPGCPVMYQTHHKRRVDTRHSLAPMTRCSVAVIVWCCTSVTKTFPSEMDRCMIASTMAGTLGLIALAQHEHGLTLQGEEAALELQHLQMQQQQAVAIQSVLLTPFKSPSPRTLYALWGWLRPPPQKGQPSAGAAAGGCSTSQLQHSESEEQASSMAAEAVPHDSEVGSPGREAEPWWALAGALHEVVCSLGRQQTQLVQVIREQRESEVCLLQDSIKAYQVRPCVPPRGGFAVLHMPAGAT